MSIASIHLEMEGVHTFAEIRNMKEREGGREVDGGRELYFDNAFNGCIYQFLYNNDGEAVR